AVGRPWQQRHLLAGDRTQRLGIAAAPVLVDQRSRAQAANAGAAPPQEAAEDPRLGQRDGCLRSSVRPLFEGNPLVGRTQRADMPNMPDPRLVLLVRLMGG